MSNNKFSCHDLVIQVTKGIKLVILLFTVQNVMKCDELSNLGHEQPFYNMT